MPALSSLGRIFLGRQCSALRYNSSDNLRVAASTSGGVKLSGKTSMIRASTCLRMPDTRTMKNSSMFEPKMARNFRRSSSGLRSSCASSRTRRWNSSRLSSRLMYRDGEDRSTGSVICFLFVTDFRQYTGGQQPLQGRAMIIVMKIIRCQVTYPAFFEGNVYFRPLRCQQSYKSTQMRLMPYHRYAVYGVLLLNFTHQEFRVSRWDQVVAIDDLFLHFEYICQDLGRLACPHIWTRKDQIKFHTYITQAFGDLAHFLAPFVSEWPLAV